MDIKLSEGALKRITDGEIIDKPTIQIMGYKKVPGGQDRYRFLVSDGLLCHPLAMLATQLNDRLLNKEFEKYTVVKLEKYTCTEMQPGKKILILLELTVLASGEIVGRKLGNPTQVNTGTGAANTTSEPSRQNGQVEEQRNTYNEPPVTVKREALSETSAASNFSNTRSESSFNTTVKVEPYVPPARTMDAGQPPFQGSVHAISALSPYQNKWVIKARVTGKTSIRSWSNARGEGRLFSMDLVDESGEIRATVFTNEVDRFYNLMEINKVYYIQKASIKTANKKFSSTRNDYELSFSAETTVSECNEVSDKIPMLSYNFRDISSLSNLEPGILVDVIGVCKSNGDVTSITQRSTNKELRKRDIHLVDKSATEISLTLWDTNAENFDGSSNPIVAVKGARLSDYNGRSLSLVMASTMMINPDIREAHTLRGWYDQEGATANIQSVTTSGGMSGASTNWKTFAQITAENLGHGEKPDYFTSKAMISLIKKDNCMYQACPGENCNKKVQDLQDGNYRCEKCQRDFPNFKWRLLVNMNLSDFTDSIWVTSFQENSETVLGVTAEELGRMKQTDESAFEDVISNAQFKSYIFKIRAKVEVYNEESRVKLAIVNVTPLNFIDYGQKLLADIKKLEPVLP